MIHLSVSNLIIWTVSFLVSAKMISHHRNNKSSKCSVVWWIQNLMILAQFIVWHHIYTCCNTLFSGVIIPGKVLLTRSPDPPILRASWRQYIPIKELQEYIKKGLASTTPVHHRLQIEFQYTKITTTAETANWQKLSRES